MNIDKLINYFHSAGRPFIGMAVVITVLAYMWGGAFFFICLVLTAWCFYFFRDPDRVTPEGAGLIISPADGRVVAVREVIPDADLGLGAETRTRISIFLNVFNVHVNRMPADGVVRARYYRPGAFVNASLDKASVDNERMAVVLQLVGDHPCDNQTIGVVQIAGLIARRIVCTIGEGDTVKAGERYGIIRFGSRADIYLPVGIHSQVVVGQTMIAGETILADCKNNPPQRHGVVREAVE